MRRTAQQRASDRIKIMYPKWFYKRCRRCKDDVKWEAMWCRLHVWLCTTCAVHKADAIEFYEEFDKNPRPGRRP